MPSSVYATLVRRNGAPSSHSGYKLRKLPDSGPYRRKFDSYFIHGLLAVTCGLPCLEVLTSLDLHLLQWIRCGLHVLVLADRILVPVLIRRTRHY
jgi:hypothetical protein